MKQPAKELPRVIDAINEFAEIQRRITTAAGKEIDGWVAQSCMDAADFARRILAIAPECLAACAAGDPLTAAELAGRILMLARLVEQRALSAVERRSAGQQAVLMFANAIPRQPRAPNGARKVDFSKIRKQDFERPDHPATLARRRKVSLPDTHAQSDAR